MSLRCLARAVALLAVIVIAGCDGLVGPAVDPAATIVSIGSDAVETGASEHWSVRVYAADQLIDAAWIDPGEPIAWDVRLDAGQYRIEARVQRCDGPCDRLLTEGRRACSVRVSLGAGDRASVSVDRSDDGRCAFWVEG